MIYKIALQKLKEQVCFSFCPFCFISSLWSSKTNWIHRLQRSALAAPPALADQLLRHGLQVLEGRIQDAGGDLRVLGRPKRTVGSGSGVWVGVRCFTGPKKDNQNGGDFGWGILFWGRTWSKKKVEGRKTKEIDLCGSENGGRGPHGP